MNNVTLRGYVVKDSTTKTIGKNNTPCLNFSIGQNISFKNERNNIEKRAMFFDVNVYGNYVNFLGTLKKGTLVFLQGKLVQNIWEKDGQKYSKVSIVASKVYPVQRLDSMPNTQTTPQSPQQDTHNIQAYDVF